MSKKVKGAGFEDGRPRFKHQTLLQDYFQLQKETEAARSKFEVMRLKKLTLQAEFGFLRRRHKFLLKNKSSTPQDIRPRSARYRKSSKEKEAALQNIKQNGRAYVGIPPDDMLVLHGAMEDSGGRAYMNISKQPVRTKSCDVSELETPTKTRPAPTFDLNQISREADEDDEVRSVCMVDEKVKLLMCGVGYVYQGLVAS